MRTRAIYGETTKQFLTYLIENGPTSAKKLSKEPFWGGVKTRIPALIKQGRVQKIDVANDDLSLSNRFVLSGYKALCSIDDVGPVSGNRSGNPLPKNYHRDRARLSKKIDDAIAVLSDNGYSVVKNDTQGRLDSMRLAVQEE